MSEHAFGAQVDTGVKRLALGIETDAENAKTCERITALLSEFGHRLARGKAYFNRADELGGIVSVNLFGSLAIESGEQAMEVAGTARVLAFAESYPQRLGAFGPLEKPIEESAQIKAGTTNDDWEMFARTNFGEYLARTTGVFAGGHRLLGIDDIKQMVRREGAFLAGGLRGADVELAIDGHGIAVHDFTGKFPGDRK
jgi:hypothetical protein